MFESLVKLLTEWYRDSITNTVDTPRTKKLVKTILKVSMKFSKIGSWFSICNFSGNSYGYSLWNLSSECSNNSFTFFSEILPNVQKVTYRFLRNFIKKFQRWLLQQYLLIILQRVAPKKFENLPQNC